MTVPGCARSVCVAFNERARRECMNRFGAWDIVVSWEECQAWAAGVDEASGPERQARTLQALAWFCQRQGLSFA